MSARDCAERCPQTPEPRTRAAPANAGRNARVMQPRILALARKTVNRVAGRIRRGARQGEDESRADSELARHRERAAHPMGQLAPDRQPQPTAVDRPGETLLDLHEGVEDALPL